MKEQDEGIRDVSSKEQEKRQNEVNDFEKFEKNWRSSSTNGRSEEDVVKTRLNFCIEKKLKIALIYLSSYLHTLVLPFFGHSVRQW